MIAIVCLDEQNGMAFNLRRQSKDRVVIEDILKESERSLLYLNEYSYGLFKDFEVSHIKVSETYLDEAEKGSYCFVENKSLSSYIQKIEQIVVYRWNRRYPADVYLGIELNSGWKKVSTSDFTGFSHECITKEIYVK